MCRLCVGDLLEVEKYYEVSSSEYCLDLHLRVQVRYFVRVIFNAFLTFSRCLTHLKEASPARISSQVRKVS